MTKYFKKEIHVVMNYFQEAAAFTDGVNFAPMRMRYRLPAQRTDTSIFLLSNSYEYDIELIRNMPPPRVDFKHIIIPVQVNVKLGVKQFSYRLPQIEYNKKLSYMNGKSIIPKLTDIRFPYPGKITNNLYAVMSELFKQTNVVVRSLSVDYIQNNICNMFSTLIKPFDFSKTKVLIIDTERYPIYKEMNENTYNADMVNALLTVCVLAPDKIKNMNMTFIFRAPEADYKFDISKYSPRDVERLADMLAKIGTKTITSTSNSIDDVDDGEKTPIFYNKEADDEYDGLDIPDEVEKINDTHNSVTNSIRDSINILRAKLANATQTNEKDVTQQNMNKPDSLYNAKVIGVQAELFKRIVPDNDVVSKYKSVSDSLLDTGDSNPVEKDIVDDASNKLSDVVEPTDEDSVMTTTTSAREQQIREQLGKLKLNDVTFDKLTSVSDIPLPEPLKPLRLTTTNRGAQVGSRFTNIAREYEEKLLDRDIVATFMNLSKLPDGFYVTNVEVTDVSNVTSLMNNWRVTLKNKRSEKQSVINIRVPKVINGRFYNNGNWYNIGKQDFPIPILKVNRKKVIVTSNYNKITVERYDTRSLVDINMLKKLISAATDAAGVNKYIRIGSSTNTNSSFVSTIEYDEYSKMWYSFINEESSCEVYFNRQDCLKRYGFVSVQQNEFCCGMINKVPIVLNTDTGLTRDGKTLTETILRTLPENMQVEYSRAKPGKLSMYAQITIGSVVPLGVAIAAWEGIGSLLKKCGCKYQFVDKGFADPSYFIIQFKDKNLAIQNTINAQLIFNGFYRLNTKANSYSEFEIPIMSSNSIYVDIFNQIFFKQYSQLTTFITYYNFFVDAITQDVCSHYKLPNTISGMLIYAANMLADNNYTSENNASLYRIRSSEVIPAIIHYHLAVAISRYNNTVGSRNKENALMFNPNEVVNELINAPNVSPMSALNPMVELNAREVVTKKGFRGVNSDRVSVDRRSYHDSMVGKMALSSPNNGTVGINRQLVADPKLESVRGYTSTVGMDGDFNDLQLASFSELLTPGTVTRDDAIRTAIATSQTSHIVSTDGAQPVLISNGVDEIVPSYLTEEFSFTAPMDGKVIEITDDYMIVEYTNGKKKAIFVGDKYSFNTGSGFYVNNKLKTNFEAGETFKKNDILAYHDKFFSKDSTGIVRLNIGPLAKVAFAGLYSTYEDAGLITEKMSKKLSTRISLKQMIKINAIDDIERVVKVGDEIEIGDPLVVFGLGNTGDKAVDNFLKAFGDDNALEGVKRSVRSVHAGRVVDVRMYTNKSMDKLSPSLFEIFDEYFKTNIKKRKVLDKHDKTNSVYKLDTLYSLPTEPLKTPSIKGINCDVMIEVYIEHEDEASVGDKLVVYGASKQVLSEVVPQGLEPYAESTPNEEISMFVAPSSILKRMIPSLTITASGNKVLLELKRQMRNIWESN